nr:ATPase, F1/V1/A1 complex, alpha/beta subunit, zinc knuckle CX2CX4HX4C [Tanacetum cinerariifolium]
MIHINLLVKPRFQDVPQSIAGVDEISMNNATKNVLLSMGIGHAWTDQTHDHNSVGSHLHQDATDNGKSFWKFGFSLYGYFVGKRAPFPIVKNYIRNSWKKYVNVRVMINSKGFFFFKFALIEGMKEDDREVLHTVRVEYEWEPPICGVCVVFGHDGVTCSKLFFNEPKMQNISIVGFQQPLKRASSGINLGSKSRMKLSTLWNLRDLRLIKFQKVVVEWEIRASMKNGRRRMMKTRTIMMFDDCGLADAQIAFANSFNNSLRSQLR